VHEHMGFAPAFGATELGPGKEGQAKGDGGRIEREQLVLEAESALANAQLLLRAEALQGGIEQFLVKRGGAMLVGVGQGGFVGSFGDAQMHQLAQTAGQAVADLAQGIGMAQLAEQHGDELGPAIEPLGGPLGFVLLDQTRELQAGKVMQQLIEQACDLYHGGALLNGVQRCLSNIILKPPLQEGNCPVHASPQKPLLDTSDFVYSPPAGTVLGAGAQTLS